MPIAERLNGGTASWLVEVEQVIENDKLCDIELGREVILDLTPRRQVRSPVLDQSAAISTNELKQGD